MESLDVDDLMHLMPDAVREEYRLHGDASIFGFTPGVKRWLETCTHPRVERWRNDLKRHSAEVLKAAVLEQQRMNDIAKALYADARSSVRIRAVIHPVIKGWMETQHGPRTFTDRESIADTERLQPKLFVNK
jgi:hypothetical protein